MKKREKVILLLCILVLFVFIVSGCDSSNSKPTNAGETKTDEKVDDNKQVENDNVEYISLNDYYFAYGISKSKIDNYFKTNGKKKNEYGYGDYYSISKDSVEVGYFPEKEQFIAACKFSTKSYLSSLNVDYTYEYLGQVSVNYYGSMSEATLVGKTDATGISRNTYQIVSADSGSWNYTTSVVESSYELPTYNKVTARTSGVNKFDTEYCKNSYDAVKGAWSYMISVFKSIENKNIISKYNASDFSNLNWGNVTFTNKTFKLDGEKHKITPTNVPDGVKVTYENNDKSEAGTYNVTAKFSDPKGIKLKEMNASLIIDDMFNVNIDYYWNSLKVTSRTIPAKHGSDITDILTADVTDDDGLKYVFDSVNTGELKYVWNYSNISKIIYVKSEHSGYVLVKSSTNSSINNKYLSISSVFKQSSDIQTSKPQGETTDVSYYLSDIEYIKFSNELSLPQYTINGTIAYYGTYLTNVKEIDLSELKYVEEIPYGFMSGCKKLTKVTGGKLDSLVTIGNDFLKDTNITTFDLDLSKITKIGTGFMNHAFEGEEARNITIDLSSLTKIGNWTSAGITNIESRFRLKPAFLCQKTMNANSKVTLKMGNYLLTDAYFYEYQYVNGNDVYYGSYNLDLYSNNKTQQQTLLTKLNGNITFK